MPDIYFRIAAMFLAIGMFINSLEILAYKELYVSTGLMNWETTRMRSLTLFKSKFLARIMGERNIRHLAYFRFLCAVALTACILLNIESLVLPTIFLAFLSYLIYSVRTPYGLDGSDQASFLVATVFTIYALTNSEIVRSSVHWFLGAQLTLVYFTSGWNKLRARDWRNGKYLWQLFSTGFYGMEKLGDFLNKHRWFATFSSMCLLLFETFFFIYWFVPLPYSWMILSCLGIFHLVTAITMGLNTFFWAFLSMYPSAIYCRLLLG